MSNDKKYALGFSVQAQNLFNDINYGTPSGTVVSTYIDPTAGTYSQSATPGQIGAYGPGQRFGESTSLSGGMFSSPSSLASRRISFQMTFSF
jgi:hypothetical protein